MRRDLTGMVFHWLTVTGKQGKGWLCRCICGKTKYVEAHDLLHDKTKSCGCWKGGLGRDRNRIHGMAGTHFYGIWEQMKARTTRVASHNYRFYGGRGIGLSDEWSIFNNFYKDMYQSYLSHLGIYGRKDTTIDRVDNDAGYSVSNCRWSNRKEQANNRRPRSTRNK